MEDKPKKLGKDEKVSLHGLTLEEALREVAGPRKRRKLSADEIKKRLEENRAELIAEAEKKAAKQEPEPEGDQLKD